jgi:Tfp pilus assembly protein PilX
MSNVSSIGFRPCAVGVAVRHGSGLVIALVTLLVVTSIMGSIMYALLSELRQTRQTVNEVQAQWLADAAVERAARQLTANADYKGETWNIDLPATATGVSGDRHGIASIRIDRGTDDNSRRILVRADFPTSSRRRVVAERTVSISSVKNNSPASDSRKETRP